MLNYYRPECPKCGMNMVATTKAIEGDQAFECLRCGHATPTRPAMRRQAA